MFGTMHKNGSYNTNLENNEGLRLDCFLHIDY